MQRFDGPDYDHARDSERLSAQLDRVRELMRDGQWRTLKQISAACDAPESSVSAQLRHLRKPRFGGHTVDKMYVTRGLYQYRLTLATASD